MELTLDEIFTINQQYNKYKSIVDSKIKFFYGLRKIYIFHLPKVHDVWFSENDKFVYASYYMRDDYHHFKIPLRYLTMKDEDIKLEIENMGYEEENDE